MTLRRSSHVSRAGIFSSVVFVSTWLIPAAAFADDAQDIAAARAFGSEGVTLAEDGKCKDAIEKLRAAEKLHHAPTTAERLGECLIDVGKVVDGTEALRRLLRESLAPGAPPAFAAAIARAQRVLDKALPRVANLRISVTAPPGTKPTLLVDGEQLSELFMDNDRPTDPGTHEVKAMSPGFLPASAQVKLSDGESQRISLKLEPDPSWKKPAPSPVATATPVAEPAAQSEPTPAPSSSNLAAYAALGTGGVGLIVGAVTGALAVSRQSAVNRECLNKTCVRGSTGESDLSAAKSLGTVSTVGFLVGGAAVGVGAIMLLTKHSAPPASTAASGMRVRPLVGATFLGLDGTF